MKDDKNRGIDAIPLTEEQHQTVINAFQTAVTQQPPTIGLIGVSGVGKSSTINRMFKTHLAVSDTIACTKEFKSIDLELRFTKGQAKNADVQLRVIDAPGLGEDIHRDPQYINMYRSNLPACDVILWLLTARNRAIALDQQYLQQFKDFHQKIVFGINQVDLLEPLDWDETINLPSDKQLENIDIIVQDRKSKLEDVLQKEIVIIPYSSRKGFNLQILFTSLLEACPEKRAWIFHDIKNFAPEQFVPREALKEVNNRQEKARVVHKVKPFGTFFVKKDF